LAARHRPTGKRENIRPALGWPAGRRFLTFPRVYPFTPVMLLIATFSVTVLLLCYSGESKH